MLGCVGYGSVFLALGLYVRNPIVPAAVLLAWEGVNGILPHALQKLSILYYLQSLCPVPAPMDDGRADAHAAAGGARRARLAPRGDSRAAAPDRVRPVGRRRAVRRMQISYGSDA